MLVWSGCKQTESTAIYSTVSILVIPWKKAGSHDYGRQEGKIRVAGCSNFTAEQLTSALGLSERHGWTRMEITSLITIWLHARPRETFYRYVASSR
jgi:hypothetical protein